jgi:yecA family protein
MTDNFPEYSDLQQALEKLEPPLYPSEVHGGLCGLLCSTASQEPQHWLATIIPGLDEDNLLQRDAARLLMAMHTTTLQQLNDPTCDFHLLLPDDDAPILDRVDALGDWCQGFLTGLSMGGVTDLNALPQDAAEIIKDMTEIARAGSAYDLQGTEEDEEAYQELVEYIRVGALLINEELHPQKSTGPVLH